MSTFRVRFVDADAYNRERQSGVLKKLAMRLRQDGFVAEGMDDTGYSVYRRDKPAKRIKAPLPVPRPARFPQLSLSCSRCGVGRVKPGACGAPCSYSRCADVAAKYAGRA